MFFFSFLGWCKPYIKLYHQSLSTVSFFLSEHWITFLFLLAGADKAHRIQRPKSAKAESCTRKCVSTCIRGGAGAPGEGPLNVRRYVNLCCPSYWLHFIGVKLLFCLYIYLTYHLMGLSLCLEIKLSLVWGSVLCSLNASNGSKQL